MLKEAPPPMEEAPIAELPIVAEVGPINPLEPTPSLPIQMAVPTTTVAAAPSLASFPGMPTIGAPVMQSASMTTALPYGNYAAQPTMGSTYVTAPSAYSQQLGMTTNLTAL